MISAPARPPLGPVLLEVIIFINIDLRQYNYIDDTMYNV